MTRGSGLTPGYFPWTEAAWNIELVDNDPRVPPFDAAPGNFGFVNSDLAFTGDSRHRRQLQRLPGLRHLGPDRARCCPSSFVCPGGQGDVSVFGDLLFMSVEETRGRIDCGTQGAPGAVNMERFRGVRIFDISDLSNPVQLPGVQTCRGSHTHSIVTDPDDPDNIYIYNSGTSSVRSPLELAGCENAALTTSPVTTGNPTQWRIDVIKVPLAAPQTAAIVSQPRIFTDPATGAFNGLQNTQPGRAASVRHRVLAAAQHEHVPRHHVLSGARHRRRRLPGQRHPARHLRPGEPACASTPSPTRTSRTGTRRRSATTARRSSSRTSGAAARRPVAGRPTSPSGAPTPSSTSSARATRGRWSSAATTRCRRCRRSRRTASPTTRRCYRCPTATSSSRRGTRAGCR